MARTQSHAQQIDRNLKFFSVKINKKFKIVLKFVSIPNCNIKIIIINTGASYIAAVHKLLEATWWWFAELKSDVEKCIILFSAII